MQEGDVIRVLAAFAVAGAGAGLALAGAAVTGQLGSHTTIERIAATPSAPSGGAGQVAARDLSVEQIYRLDAPGVVRITTSSNPSRRTAGSGFVIDKAGHIVTSNHVVQGAGGLKVSFSGNDELNATLVGNDPSTDVAVLQVTAHSRSLSPLPLGDSDDVQVGDPVVAIGNPPSLNRTATAGIVSGLQHTIDAATGPMTVDQAIQTDATIDNGNSGGPLINVRGEVIGVNFSADSAGSTIQGTPGVGFAIPIDTVKNVVAELIRFGKVEHAYLGIDALPVTPSLARICDLPASSGLLVQRVTAGSAAAAAGLRSGRTAVLVAGESYRIGGDIIIAADGVPVSSEAQLRNVLQTMKPGDHLALSVWRGAGKKTIRVTLGRPPG